MSEEKGELPQGPQSRQFIITLFEGHQGQSQVGTM